MEAWLATSSISCYLLHSLTLFFTILMFFMLLKELKDGLRKGKEPIAL
jgi:hypothetical protein